VRHARADPAAALHHYMFPDGELNELGAVFSLMHLSR
jgi:hypothetical protein